MDPLSVDSATVKALEQANDQIEKKLLAVYRPDPSKTTARQNATNFNLKLLKVSGEVEQAQRQMNASNAQDVPQAKQAFVYWKTQMALLESQKPLSTGGQDEDSFLIP